MSLRKDFKREANLVVGKRPKGVEVDTDENNHIILKYNVDDAKQQLWVFDCEEKMDQRYKIWVEPYAEDIDEHEQERKL
jgi:hypothetical protein